MDGHHDENQAHDSPVRDTCGIDEAGRGPLAGPVVAAAAVLRPGFDESMLADSKVLSARQREFVRAHLLDQGTTFGIGWVWPVEIDRINIHQASLLAMYRAWADMAQHNPDAASRVGEILVDGRFYPAGIPVPGCAVIGGDHIHSEIMAASILAKTSRDRWMTEYAGTDGRYGFERHKGYPTAAHKAAIRLHGPCAIHRRTFRGVREYYSGC